jgi:hypothetical protein
MPRRRIFFSPAPHSLFTVSEGEFKWKGEKMGDFEDAQKLFADYERDDGINNLRDSLELLEEIIEEKGLDADRARNFKMRICHHVNKRLNDLLDKSGMVEFGIKLASLSQTDGRLLLHLQRLKREFFPD